MSPWAESWPLMCGERDSSSQAGDWMGTAITILTVMIALVASLAFAFMIMDFLLTASFSPRGSGAEHSKAPGILRRV